jgi:PAS domain S-box-containing protein
MTFLQDIPIKRKILVITVSISGAMMLLSLALLFGFQVVNFRKGYERDAAAISELIANNSTAALSFADQSGATELLISLRAKPSIVGAVLLDADGTTFARYGSAAGIKFNTLPQDPGFKYVDGYLLRTQPVELNRKRVGTLFTLSDYQSALNELLEFYALMACGIIPVAFWLAVFLTNRLSRIVADPVVNLAKTARDVAEVHDYSVRTPLNGRKDELGALAGAFNHMLSEIERQRHDLALSQRKLESLVNSIDGIVWEWNPKTNKFTFASLQSGRILGVSADQWTDDSQFWQTSVHYEDISNAVAARSDAVAKRQSYQQEYRMLSADKRTVWMRESGAILVENGEVSAVRGILQDITEQKKSARRLEELNRELIDASRQAGMAEIATGVLHNVGNVLNSVNVSATLLVEQVKKSELATLRKVVDLVKEKNGSLADYLTNDPKGRIVPQFIGQVTDQLQREREIFAKELNHLSKNVEHIKQIVSTQQSYAKVAGVMEKISLQSLVEDALQINSASILKSGIHVVREFNQAPMIILDKHKTLQIIINLIRNARHAVDEACPPEKKLTISIAGTNSGASVKVSDNGVGIPSENLTKIFSHGFTTKRNGHGFGLHLGALSAKEMGGSISVSSDGPGRGATFTLELPLNCSKKGDLAVSQTAR